MTTFKVVEASTREELDAIVDCLWAVMEGTATALKVFCPIITDRDTALRECKERIWNDHVKDPTGRWIYVRDSSCPILKVLGTCQWRIYEQNPYPDGMPDVRAAWWPEGEGREFAIEFLKQRMAPRVAWMSRPHVGLSWCVVLIEHQKNRIGQELMSWGIAQTDKLGLESYLEATPEGRKLYQRFGYRPVAEIDLDINDHGRGEQWRSLRKEVLPSGSEAMWRPIRGVWDKEEPQRTWRGRMRVKRAHEGAKIHTSL
ncbi:MAG: hypothetical protein M1820_009863 [Bogoriella megaspora]|nr:MAG: hypothetical protein M1820_009863 [Bogoriella megaspora]